MVEAEVVIIIPPCSDSTYKMIIPSFTIFFEDKIKNETYRDVARENVREEKKKFIEVLFY